MVDAETESWSVDSGENGEYKQWCCEPAVFTPCVSSSLDATNSWYTLISSLCCCKPSMFFSTEFAKVFPNEYRQFNSSEVFGEDGAPASLRWFSSDGRHREKVYVCSTIGFVLGILRGRQSGHRH